MPEPLGPSVDPATTTAAWASVADLYAATLGAGQTATDTFYDCLRQRGIRATVQTAGDFYVSNPVIVPGHIVDWMTEDLNRFANHRRQATRDPADLLATLPEAIRRDFASTEVAAVIWQRLQIEPPLAALDAFLVDTPDGLQPAYVEWQTVGTYATLGCWVLRCAQAAWPALATASPTATRGWDIAALEAQLAALYLNGIEDDPRQGVILDYKPLEQKSRREFFAIQALTGGATHGWGIIDPREVVYQAATPYYRRDGALIPIRRAYSRLVHGDIIDHLWPEASPAEQTGLRRLFGDPSIDWLGHPIHFYYGAKADFIDFSAANLSPRLPTTWLVTDEVLGELHRAGRDPLVGLVSKPTLGNSGHSVEADPPLAHVEVGSLLQVRFQPAACHPTLFGPTVPEIRLMGIPHQGRLTGAALYNRVMPPAAFKSNAAVVAAQGAPGTGEGFGFVVW